MEFLHYGRVFGASYESPLLDEYRKKIQKDFQISIGNDEEDVIETLKLSLENGKTFYENAKPYMKKKMEKIQRNLNNINVDY